MGHRRRETGAAASPRPESAIIGDRAYEAGTSTVTVNGEPLSGKYGASFKRVGGQWLIAFDSFSAAQPPPPGTK